MWHPQHWIKINVSIQLINWLKDCLPFTQSGQNITRFGDVALIFILCEKRDI